jgi:WD40 repeat protein
MRSSQFPIFVWAVSAIISTSIGSPSSAHAQNATSRVSVDSNGNEAAGLSQRPAISGDGRFVAFFSNATNFAVPPSTHEDIYVHDRVTGATVRISNSIHGGGADWQCLDPSISGDGRYVTFASSADDLVGNDSNGQQDIFVHDRDPDGNGIFDEGNGVTTLASVDSGGAQGNGYSDQPHISSDGTKVAFWSNASNLVAGDVNVAPDIFLRDLVAGTTSLVSVDSSGVQGDDRSLAPSISSDGMVVAFYSEATNLVPGDSNGVGDVFVRDLARGTTTRISVDSSGNEGDGPCDFTPSISADGAIVGFSAWADDLVPGDTNGSLDVFVHDRNSGITTRISVDSHGNEGNWDSYLPSLSSDGSIVAFFSTAGNLVSTDSGMGPDIFRHDRSTGVTSRIDAGCQRGEADDVSNSPSLSADGSIVAYDSLASNLVAGDTNGNYDVFVHDASAATFPASWTNYGAGLAGTLGIPALVAQNPPTLGTTLTIDVGNSYGLATTLALFFGFQTTDVPLKGGHLLVQPAALFIVPIGAAGMSFSSEIPEDEAICGVEVFLQALELDPGAVKGISFSAGLDLVVGH